MIIQCLKFLMLPGSLPLDYWAMCVKIYVIRHPHVNDAASMNWPVPMIGQQQVITESYP